MGLPLLGIKNRLIIYILNIVFSYFLGQDLATGTRMMTERMEIAIQDLAQEIVEDLEADPDPEVQ